jgi:cytochrome oxidase assembly protein ShyY1
VPREPIRTEPAPYDETMHLSYAIQWFLFAAILSIGSLFLARARRRGTPTLVPEMRRADS